MSDREQLLDRIRTAPDVDSAFARIVELADHDALVTAAEWYGDTPPSDHAVCIMASLPVNAAERPYLHTASFGKEAYEAYHTYHYLLDLLRSRERPQLVEAPFVVLDAAMRAIGASAVEFLELGSSLYAAVEKLENCERRSPGSRPEVRHLGVELSDWLRKIAALVHPAHRLEQFGTYREVPAPQVPRFLFSRGVGNYAFRDAGECAEWVMTSRFALLREYFALGSDVTTHIMGKRFVCFSLPELVRRVAASGRSACVISCAEARPFLDGDVPGSPVFVEAFVAIHDLTAAEHVRFGQYVRSANPSTLSSTFNTDPPISMNPDMLNSNIGPASFAGIAWRRHYVRSLSSDADAEPRFDFSESYRRDGAISLRDGIADHVNRLDRVYSGAIGRAAVSSRPNKASADVAWARESRLPSDIGGREALGLAWSRLAARARTICRRAFKAAPRAGAE